MYSITGRSIYEVRTPFRAKFASEDLHRRVRALPHGSLPGVQIPGRDVLDALRASWPKKQKIFEGEAEYQQHLREKGLVETEDDYVSQVRQKDGPSLD
jgi:hypothetical protein